jgi:hypothetical protein
MIQESLTLLGDNWMRAFAGRTALAKESALVQGITNENARAKGPGNDAEWKPREAVVYSSRS